MNKLTPAIIKARYALHEIDLSKINEELKEHRSKTRAVYDQEIAEVCMQAGIGLKHAMTYEELEENLLKARRREQDRLRRMAKARARLEAAGLA